MNFNTEWKKRRLTTPRTAAIAGILFGLLFSTSLVLMRTAIPEEINSDTSWVTAGSSRINLALGLMPFAGIAYLWFIGVVRDKLGEFEDKFFSTVFFGSSLVFIGLVFVAMAIAGGILTTYKFIGNEAPDYTVIYFARSLMLHISNVYALRMAGVTMISLGTIWMRTGLMPRWLACGDLFACPSPAGGGQLQSVVHPGVSRLGHFDQPVHPVDAPHTSGYAALYASGNRNSIKRCNDGMDQRDFPDY